jgi:hypothetical protein
MTRRDTCDPDGTRVSKFILSVNGDITLRPILAFAASDHFILPQGPERAATDPDAGPTGLLGSHILPNR